MLSMPAGQHTQHMHCVHWIAPTCPGRCQKSPARPAAAGMAGQYCQQLSATCLVSRRLRLHTRPARRAGRANGAAPTGKAGAPWRACRLVIRQRGALIIRQSGTLQHRRRRLQWYRHMSALNELTFDDAQSSVL